MDGGRKEGIEEELMGVLELKKGGMEIFTPTLYPYSYTTLEREYFNSDQVMVVYDPNLVLRNFLYNKLKCQTTPLCLPP